jgi:hypothetical protein
MTFVDTGVNFGTQLFASAVGDADAVVPNVITRRGATVVAIDHVNAQVSIQFAGSSTTVPGVKFLNSYYPYVGDVVEVAITNDGAPIILGHIAVEDGTIIAPTLLNTYGWWADTNFGNPGGYTKRGNIVFLYGLLTAGTAGSPAFTLPAGYRPQKNWLFMGGTGTNTVGRFDVMPSGSVTPQFTVGGTTWLSIACSFPAFA